MSWLWSADAIKAHAVFLVAISLLGSLLLAGDRGPGNDYPLALAFCCIAYPTVLALTWLKRRIDGGNDRAAAETTHDLHSE